MAFKRGDVVLVPFPFSDLRAIKTRPAVVVSSQLYHQNEPDVLLMALTSKVDKAVGVLDYILQDWRSAGLHFPSASKLVLFTLDPERIVYHIGTLSSRDLRAVDIRLRQALGL